MDIDNNGDVDVKKFRHALDQPSAQLQQFAKSYPSRHAGKLATDGAAEPLNALRDLSRDQLEESAIFRAYILSRCPGTSSR